MKYQTKIAQHDQGAMVAARRSAERREDEAMPTTLHEEQGMKTPETVVALRAHMSEGLRHMEAWMATTREAHSTLKRCLQVVVFLEQVGAQAAWEDVDAAHRAIQAAQQTVADTLPRLQAELEKHLTLARGGLQELGRATHAEK